MYMFNPPWLLTGQQRPSAENGYGLPLGWCARGDVAEWLGRGLQSLVHQFESGRRLRQPSCLPHGYSVLRHSESPL